MTSENIWNSLGEEPRMIKDCCCSLSKPLIKALAKNLPSRPSLVLSIGSGSGLLEDLIRQCANIDIYGVEVPSCPNLHLPGERILRVATSSDLYPDAILAEALIFCYPRTVQLVDAYLKACAGGALETVVFISHRDEWPAFQRLFLTYFAPSNLNTEFGELLPDYEVLAIAKLPLEKLASV